MLKTKTEAMKNKSILAAPAYIGVDEIELSILTRGLTPDARRNIPEAITRPPPRLTVGT